MTKPRLLDGCCCAGGASRGYDLAGFDVVGVDIVPHKNYPYPCIQTDILEYLDTADLSQFDAFHFSPECKGYTNCNLSPKEKYKKLIGAIRERVQKTGKPYVIENVMGAKKHLQGSLLLCGSMFGLPMQRHRIFESNIFMHPPRQCDHSNATIAVYGHSVWDSSLPGTPRKDGRSRPDSVPVEIGHKAMGIDWMNKEELAEALPPVYTEHIGQFLMQYILAAREIPA